MKKKYFNKPWMANLHPDLLYRYWIESDSKLPLKSTLYGMNVVYVRTIFGVMSIVHNSFLNDDEIIFANIKEN